MRSKEKSREANSKYWKTEKGKLMMTYNNMSRRVKGYVKPKLYKGLEICSRDEFYLWTKSSDSISTTVNEWIKSGFERRLSPSIDRVDSSCGYTVDNMQWITFSENSRRGANSRWNNELQ
tara:strand:- start:256 stop:615 length:360 start_codon:yes stop_codon:yes gene_type:complete